MKKIVLTVASMSAIALSVVSVFATPLCHDPKSKTYRLAAWFGQAAEHLHGPPTTSWREIPEGLFQEALIGVAKETVKKYLDVPLCEEFSEPIRKITREELDSAIERLRASSIFTRP
jgi:hypothetical protein